VLGGLLSAGVGAQQASPRPAVPAPGGSKPIAPPADYVIGIDDVLTIFVYGQDPMHSGDVVVRPDGKIARLMIDEIPAAGLTTQQLKAELTKAYSRFFQDPVILVSPKEIRSRKVFIVGNVVRPGEYLLNEPMNVLTLIAKAGGLLEFADREHIAIIGKDPLPNGNPNKRIFNYEKLDKIPQLMPGDHVVVK
jgi:polysaccharide export outer membrane protein